MLRLKALLKKSPLAWMGFHALQRLGFIAPRGFHGDRMMQRLVLEMIRFFNIESFIETGTNYGESTFFVAMKARRLKIYTSELNKQFYSVATRRLGHFGNVRVAIESSPGWLLRLLSNGQIGGRPLFFLDARWYDYWPLEDEIEIITSNVREAVILIDDFQVPGREDFVYAVGGGGSPGYGGRTTVDERPCNSELIRPKLNPGNHYDLLFPDYTLEEAYPDSSRSHLRGHVVIFQNLGSDFQRFGEPEGYRAAGL